MGGEDDDIGPEPTEQEEEVCFDFYTNELIVLLLAKLRTYESKYCWPMRSVVR